MTEKSMRHAEASAFVMLSNAPPARASLAFGAKHPFGQGEKGFFASLGRSFL
jgi:hypothetical protein